MYPKIVGLLLQGLPKMGPLIFGTPHMAILETLQDGTEHPHDLHVLDRLEVMSPLRAP